MAWTYKDDLVADRDKIRFAIGDTVSGSGPKPEDGNFTDAELDGLFAIEGSWPSTTAAAFETLAALWSKQVTFSAQEGNMSAQLSDVATQYRKSAAEWRAKASALGGSDFTLLGSGPAIRADGYSNNLDNVSA